MLVEKLGRTQPRFVCNPRVQKKEAISFVAALPVKVALDPSAVLRT
jgi:hypothetical protein